MTSRASRLYAGLVSERLFYPVRALVWAPSLSPDDARISRACSSPHVVADPADPEGRILGLARARPPRPRLQGPLRLGLTLWTKRGGMTGVLPGRSVQVSDETRPRYHVYLAIHTSDWSERDLLV